MAGRTLPRRRPAMPGPHPVSGLLAYPPSSFPASRRGDRAIEDAVRSVRRPEPGPIALVQGGDRTVDAPERQARIDRSTQSAAGGDPCGVRIGVGLSQCDTRAEPGGSGAGGVPAPAAVAASAVVGVYHGGGMVGRVGPAIVPVVPAVGRRAVGTGGVPVAATARRGTAMRDRTV